MLENTLITDIRVVTADGYSNGSVRRLIWQIFRSFFLCAVSEYKNVEKVMEYENKAVYGYAALH